MLWLLQNRFSIGVILLSCATSWADEAEDRAVAFVENRGGRVVRDEQAPGKPVLKVSMNGTSVKNTELKAIAPLMNLTHLDLAAPYVTDAGLVEVSGLKNLSHLNLNGVHVTDAGLKEVAGLKNLTRLNLAGAMTDEKMQELAGLRNLTILSVSGPDVSDVGVMHLVDLKNLSMLGLCNCRVTDATISSLRQALPKCYLHTSSYSALPEELR